MKAFASALLLAGVHAANGQIDFDITGTLSPYTLSNALPTNLAFYKAAASASAAFEITDDTKATYQVATTYASKYYTLTLTMVVGKGAKFAVADRGDYIEQFICWKQNATENLEALKSMRCAMIQFKVDTADNNVAFTYGIFSMKNPSTAIDLSTAWQINTDGSVLFYEGTDNLGSKNGFLTTSLWNQDFSATIGKTDLSTSPTLTLVKAQFKDKDGNNQTYDATNVLVGLKAMPTISYEKTGQGTAGWKFTTVTIVEASGSLTDFYTQGKLYTQALNTLSQNAQNALTGIAQRKGTAATGNGMKQISTTFPVLSATAKPQVDGLSTDAITYTTNSGMALATGLSAANSTVQSFTVGTAGLFGINVTHAATLSAAISSTAVIVNAVTCLDIFLTAPLQYLCVLTDTQRVSGTGAAAIVRIIHQVYAMEVDPVTTNFTADTLLTTAAKGLNLAASKGTIMYQATSNDVTVGTEATLKGMDKPNSKFSWPGGNYVSMDLTNMKATVSFYGTSLAAATASGDNTATVGVIKAGLASGFTATATTLDSTTKSATSQTTALAVKTAVACTDPTEAVCISKHPTKCSASGALSTVATVGAAIAALAMSF